MGNINFVLKNRGVQDNKALRIEAQKTFEKVYRNSFLYEETKDPFVKKSLKRALHKKIRTMIKKITGNLTKNKKS